MKPVTHRVVIAGHVQGVWFRESMRREAERLGVAGWVRKRDDGTVEAMVHGAEEAVQAIVAWAHQGPPRARVTAVTVEAGEGTYAVFEVRATV